MELKHRHIPGTPPPKLPMIPERNVGPVARQALAPLSPRLLDLKSTAAYLGVSQWTVRDLEASGLIPLVRLPLPNQGELRKLLFDRQDLDRLIEQWKEDLVST